MNCIICGNPTSTKHREYCSQCYSDGVKRMYIDPGEKSNRIRSQHREARVYNPPRKHTVLDEIGRTFHTECNNCGYPLNQDLFCDNCGE